MKKILLLLLTLMSLNSLAQIKQIKVKDGSFKKIDGFIMLDKYSHYDMNNRPMALIKISTEGMKAEERARLIFNGNLETYFDVKQMEAETYLYISAQAATFLEIKHPDYGKTEYLFPETLCDFCGYELVLSYESSSKPHINYFIINTDQDNAMIYIDGEFVGKKEVKKTFNIGTTHTYKIECDYYHTEEGSVTINNKVIVEKTLRPAFGYLNIKTEPEAKANVFIDNKYIGESPCESDKLKSGTYTVKVVKEMFNTTEQTFVVSDGMTTEAVLNMSSNYVNISIKTDAESDIYIDNELKGKGNWTGFLTEGEHLVEARKTAHNSSYKTIKVAKGKMESFVIDEPEPIHGYLNIDSSPFNADIFIDGEHYGKTPNIITDLLIGQHELIIRKEGYSDIKKNINIKENETLSLNETLKNGNTTYTLKETENEVVATEQPAKPERYIDRMFFGVNVGLGTGSYDFYGSLGTEIMIPIKNKFKIGPYMTVSNDIAKNAVLSFGIMSAIQFKNKSALLCGFGPNLKLDNYDDRGPQFLLGYKTKERLYFMVEYSVYEEEFIIYIANYYGGYYNHDYENRHAFLFRVGYKFGKK